MPTAHYPGLSFNDSVSNWEMSFLSGSSGCRVCQLQLQLLSAEPTEQSSHPTLTHKTHTALAWALAAKGEMV